MPREYCSHGIHYVPASQITELQTGRLRRKLCKACKKILLDRRKKLREERVRNANA